MTAPSDNFRLGYRPELDGLRAIAVLPVMAGHSMLIGKGADLLGKGTDAPVNLLGGGFYGVDIFFVLSGFLITSLLLQEHAAWRTIDFRAFYVRRALRLGPPMVLTLAGCAIYLLLAGPAAGKFDWFAILYAALYVSNFALIFGGLRLGMLTPTWSLSVEEQFYSVWPLIMSRLVRLERRTIVRIIVTMIVGCWILRAILHWAAWKFYSWPLYGSANHLILARCDGLLSGALVAMAAHWGWLARFFRDSWRAQVAAWPSVAVLAAMLIWGPGVKEGGLYGPAVFYLWYAAASVATAVLIAVLVAAPPKPLLLALRLPPVVGIGKISYGLYLYHVPIYALTSLAMLGDQAAVPVALAVVFAVATLSYLLIEKPILGLRGTIGLPRSARRARASASDRPVLAGQGVTRE